MTVANLPEDLRAATAGMVVTRADPLTRLVPDGPTGSWRLMLDDGTRLKGQMLWSPRRCERARCMIASLADVGLPQIVAWSGRAVVQEWVVGSAADPSAHAAAAGRLLGRLHRAPIPPCAANGDRWQPDAPRTRSHLVDLARAGLLDARESERVEHLLPDASRCASDLVVTHGDLAPENVVVATDRAGADDLIPVDNEACDVAPAGWDLARTWYRWPMSAAARSDFRRTYELETRRQVVGHDLVSWLLAVLVDAAAYRLAGDAAVDLPLRALRTVLRGAETRNFGAQIFASSPEICDDGAL
jgi:hypothetical protein